MSQNNPKVSIIIPVYNTEKYLCECLNSAVNQTLKDIEIICVDDCSEDSSRIILEEYARRDGRIRTVYYEKRSSASQARKDGVMMAHGQYIMFMDSDDALELNACEELSAEMDIRGVDMLQFGTFVEAEPYVEERRVQFFNRFSMPYTASLSGRDIFEACFVERKFRFNIWNKIYKAQLCKKGFAEVKDGYFPKAQDMYAFFFLAWYAETFYGIEKKYYHYKFGRGITGGGRIIGLDTLRRYCTQYDVAQQCRDFLIRQNAWDTYKDAWEKMNRDLANECVNAWFKQLSAEEGPAGLDLMADKWGCDYILQCIQNTLGSRTAEAGLKMTGAKTLVKAGICADPSDAVAPNGFESVIPVVFAINENYAPYAGVAIQSILENAGPGQFYRVYILYSRLSDNMIQLLEAQNTSNLSVCCLNVDMLVRSKAAKLFERYHYTKEMYYRFVIPEVLGFYPRVIYLDADLIVNRDIADILHPDLGDNLLAAVRNPTLENRKKALEEWYNLNANDYVNSGVLVINIDGWKAENIGEKCFRFLESADTQKLVCPDQDILNIICRGRILYLDEAWNHTWHMIYGEEERVKLYRDRVNKIGENFYVLHFADKKKPWACPELALSRYFWSYARNSLFYEIILLKSYNATIANAICAAPKNSAMYNTTNPHPNNVLTFFPQKIKGGVQCYRDHGASYTFRRALYHMGLWEDEEAPRGAENCSKLVKHIERILYPKKGK